VPSAATSDGMPGKITSNHQVDGHSAANPKMFFPLTHVTSLRTVKPFFT
jgi:hypothetical protein